MATDPTTLPTIGDIQQAKKDMTDINTFVVSEQNAFTDNQNKPRKTLTGIENAGDSVISAFETESQAAILEMQKSRGFRVVGTFADGFTYELFNDVGIDANGNSWIYVGAGLPHTVSPGTVPSDGAGYEQVTFNAAENISIGDGRSLSDIITVTNEPFVIIASGQSNALGRGSEPSTFKVNDNVKGWDNDSKSFVTIDLENSSITTSGSTYGGTPIGQSTRNSWPAAFAHRMHDETGRPVYLILDGLPGTPISEWVGNGVNSARYKGWSDNVKAALLSIGVDKANCILWHQGENDKGRTIAEYTRDLTTLRNQLKSESFTDSSTPFITASLLVKETGPDLSLQYLNHNSDPATACISVEGFEPDGTGHIYNRDLWELGYNRAWYVFNDTFNSVYQSASNKGTSKRIFSSFDDDNGVEIPYAAIGANASYFYINSKPSAANNYLESGDLGVRIYPESGGYSQVQFPLTTPDKTMNGVILSGVGGGSNPIPLFRIYAGFTRFEGDAGFTGGLRPNVNASYDLGTFALRWKNVYCGNVTASAGSFDGDVTPFTSEARNLGTPARKWIAINAVRGQFDRVTLSPISNSGSIPVNTLFVDSSDGLLKFRDNNALVKTVNLT